MKEKGQELKKLTTDREELGVNLYGIQQQLAKQQVKLFSFSNFMEIHLNTQYLF